MSKNVGIRSPSFLGLILGTSINPSLEVKDNMQLQFKNYQIPLHLH